MTLKSCLQNGQFSETSRLSASFSEKLHAREKQLVMVVTPKVINDEQGGDYGYGYQPLTQDAKKLIYQPKLKINFRGFLAQNLSHQER